jgi:hypothetical protein
MRISTPSLVICYILLPILLLTTFITNSEDIQTKLGHNEIYKHMPSLWLLLFFDIMLYLGFGMNELLFKLSLARAGLFVYISVLLATTLNTHLVLCWNKVPLVAVTFIFHVVYNITIPLLFGCCTFEKQ